MNADKRKVNIATARVLTWTPNDGQPFMAMFEGFPVSFSGASIESVKDAAHEWRVAELEKAQAIAANKERAAQRVKDARKEKEAGNA